MKKKFTFLMIVALVALLVAVTMVACNPKDAKFTVTFSLGDGVEGDAPAPIKAAENEQIVLPNVTREGFTFLGWSDGENTYAPGDSFTVVADVTLTATWHDNDAPIYTVTFSLGELEGIATPIKAIKAEANVPIVLPAATHTGYTFLSWSDGDDVYTAGSYYTATADVTLTANWRNDSLRTFTVTFSLGELADLAVAPQPKVVNDGAKIHLPAAPVIEEYNFQYWELEGTISHYDEDDEYEVRANVTFVARYRDNGFIDQEYRGDYKLIDADYSGGFLGIEEYYHITKDTIYYQGREVTDLKKLDGGGYSFTAHYWETFQVADEDTNPEKKKVGDNGITYEVWDMSFPAEMRIKHVEEYDRDMLCVTIIDPKTNQPYIDSNTNMPFPDDVLSKIDNFTVVFTGAGENGTDVYVDVDENYHVTPPEYDVAGFVGWYTVDSMGAQFLPGMLFDENQEFYQNMIYVPLYDYQGTYRSAEPGSDDQIMLEVDEEYYCFWLNGQQVGMYIFERSTKRVYVYDFNDVLMYILLLDTTNRTYTDVTPNLNLSEKIAGSWYGLYYNDLYYQLNLISEGKYTITTWEPGHDKDITDSTTKTYTTMAESIVLKIGTDTAYLSLNEDGTLAVLIPGSPDVETNMVKVGTIIGTWTSNGTTLTFGENDVLTAGSVTGSYQKVQYGSGYTASIGGENLSIAVSNWGEMTITSDSSVSKYVGCYMPGTNNYIQPLPQYDQYKGSWYGMYSTTLNEDVDQTYLLFEIDGLGHVQVYGWEIKDGEAGKKQLYNNSGSYELTDESTINWISAQVVTLYEGAFAGNGTLVFDRDVKKFVINLVLVKVGEIEANWVNESNTKAFVFNDGQVTFGDYTAPYVKGDGNWTATLNNENLTFTITEYGKLVVTSDNPDSEFAGNDFHPQKEVSLVAPEPPTPTIPAESEYYGTWEGSDGDGDFTLVIKSDKSGTIDYDAGYMSGEEPFDGSFTWTYDPATGKISFTGASFYGDEQYSCLISDGQMIMTVSGSDITLTKTADEGSKEQVDDSAQAFYGTWEGSDGDGDFTLVIKSDKSGTIDYEPDYLDEEPFNGSFTWTYDPATGKISFTSASFYEDADYTCEISGGKLVMSYGSTSVTLTKTSGGSTGGSTGGGGQDVPPAKDHDDAWYHNALKGSWSGFEHTDEWTYYLEFDGEGNVTLSYADIGPHTVLETVAYTINEDGTITFHKTFSFKIVVVDETHITVTMDGKTYNIEKLPQA